MASRVAIIGRPNVGKSTLFNRLVGRRVAIVHDQPGITRDRREAEARLGDLVFVVSDTPGLEESRPNTLAGRMLAQTKAAMEQADAILFLVDARAGLTPADLAFAEMVRRSGKPAVVVANKSEAARAAAGVLEAHELGLGEPVPISAEHGEGLADLYDALREALPGPASSAAESSAPTRPIQVAVVGRPNSGKSTLINRLLGEERLLSGPEPGITRDAIAVDCVWKDREFRIYDTAGLRRRSRVAEKPEQLSAADTLRAIRFAEVVVLLLEAGQEFEDQDLRIADLVEQEGRAIVIAVNKWDRVESRPGRIAALRAEADHKLPQIKRAPVVAISALHAEGLDRLMHAVLQAHASWNRRIPTGALNRWLEGMVNDHPPPAASGRQPKFNYLTQPKSRPPTFALFCSRAGEVTEAYRRYLVNGLLEAFDLAGTPIRLLLREKSNPYAGQRRKHRSRT
jgi:GTPase